VLGKYASEVGDLLLDCGFVDPEQVDDGWDGCFGSYEGPYVARSPAARKLIQLAKEVRSIEITDPSHGDFQFAIWMDGAGLVRVRPFGASATGFMSPEIVAPDQQFVFRQGVFQPLSSVMPGFDNSVIA